MTLEKRLARWLAAVLFCPFLSCGQPAAPGNPPAGNPPAGEQSAPGDHATTPPGTIKFRKLMIASESYESVGVFDVNNDHVPDIVSGAWWYEGPDYLLRHFIGEPQRFGEYYDDFSTIPMDINGDGKMDFVTGGWFRKTLRWYENPGKDTLWPEHIIAETGNVETSRSWDVDGDGYEELVPNTPNGPLAYYKLRRDKTGKPTSTFTRVQVLEKHGHGLGFGDINGDGRKDFIVPGGWAEAPPDPNTGKWIFHPEFNLGDAGIPILVKDLNGDGLPDFIVGQGHNFGLDWYEQKKDGSSRHWIKHSIDSLQSHYHTMEWADLDNDGQFELVTGKRYRAHNGHDPGDNDPPALYYYTWNGHSFDQHIISTGPLGTGKGTGLYFVVTDLRGKGRKDIIVAGKDGLFVFYNEGK